MSDPQSEPQQFPALRFAAQQMRKNGENEPADIKEYVDYVATYLEWMADQSADAMTFDPVFAYGLGQLALKAHERGIVARLLPEWDKLQEAYPLTAPPASVLAAGDRIAKAGVRAPPPTFGAGPSKPAPSAPTPASAVQAARTCPATDAPCTKGCVAGTRCSELVDPKELQQVRQERDTLFRTLTAKAEAQPTPAPAAPVAAPPTAAPATNGATSHGAGRKPAKPKGRPAKATPKPGA